MKGHLGKEWTEKSFEDKDRRIALVERWDGSHGGERG